MGYLMVFVGAGIGGALRHVVNHATYHRGQVVTRSMIWEHLYDEYDENTSNVVDVYSRYLRNKIDKNFDPPLILTRGGEGYMLRAEDDPPSTAPPVAARKEK